MEDETTSYKEELLRLVAKKKIKYSVKYIEKATDETLKKTYDEYQRQELEVVNEQVTSLIISKISELLDNLEWVKDNESLENDLSKNELFKRDVKNNRVFNTLRSDGWSFVRWDHGRCACC